MGVAASDGDTRVQADGAQSTVGDGQAHSHIRAVWICKSQSRQRQCGCHIFRDRGCCWNTCQGWCVIGTVDVDGHNCRVGVAQTIDQCVIEVISQ